MFEGYVTLYWDDDKEIEKRNIHSTFRGLTRNGKRYTHFGIHIKEKFAIERRDYQKFMDKMSEVYHGLHIERN